MKLIIIFLLKTVYLETAGTTYNYNQMGLDWVIHFEKCKGLQQSPIDIRTALDSGCDKRSLQISFHEDNTDTQMGSVTTAFKTPDEEAKLILSKGEEKATYKLLQFHIHSPSEHTINGKYADSEIHFVFEYTEGDKPAGDQRSITVLGFLFNYQEGSENEFFNVWNVDEDHNKEIKVNLDYFDNLVKDEEIDEYFFYDGSFTTPTCDEIVNWIVFKDVLPMSQNQRDEIRKYFQYDMSFANGNGNNRITMPLNGRVVGQSSLSQCKNNVGLMFIYTSILYILFGQIIQLIQHHTIFFLQNCQCLQFKQRMDEAKKKYLIERVMNYLRGKQKRLQKIDVFCTLEEILKNFNEDEKKDYIIFQNHQYKKEFAQYIKNNPKIQFDLNKEIFTFKKKFTDPKHFLNILEEEKVGCLENEDLYDDLDKEDIRKLKSADLIREIYIKEKKTKPAVIVLFSKNHLKNQADQTGMEQETNDFLKNYWNSIEDEALQLEKSDKYSNLKYLNRNQKISKKSNLPRVQQSRLEKNIKNWKNNFLEDKIEKALQKIKKIVEISTKNKFRVLNVNQLYQIQISQRLEIIVQLLWIFYNFNKYKNFLQTKIQNNFLNKKLQNLQISI